MRVPYYPSHLRRHCFHKAWVHGALGTLGWACLTESFSKTDTLTNELYRLQSQHGNTMSISGILLPKSERQQSKWGNSFEKIAIIIKDSVNPCPASQHWLIVRQGLTVLRNIDDRRNADQLACESARLVGRTQESSTVVAINIISIDDYGVYRWEETHHWLKFLVQIWTLDTTTSHKTFINDGNKEAGQALLVAAGMFPGGGGGRLKE